MKLVFVSSTFKDMQFERDELENDEQYHQYLEKYVEFIPNDTE